MPARGIGSVNNGQFAVSWPPNAFLSAAICHPACDGSLDADVRSAGFCIFIDEYTCGKTGAVEFSGRGHECDEDYAGII